MLEKANEYIKRNHIDEKEKSLFHVTPETGWMNDPNGFSVYQGKVHLFYQFYPYKTEWGPMHWGHQVTEDLVKWEAYPVAMAPDQDYSRSRRSFRLGFKRVKSSSSFFGFQTSAAETKFPSLSLKDIGLSPIVNLLFQ